ncbi:MAG: hypothetical protein HZT41_02385 [Dechloromonas sp.]|nr:MAG: hypothetical protein HZT41_02385 [Dechloromonas sp.]
MVIVTEAAQDWCTEFLANWSARRMRVACAFDGAAPTSVGRCSGVVAALNGDKPATAHSIGRMA